MVPALSFPPLDLPADGDDLIDFLSGEEWPFHSRARVTRDDVAAMIEKGRFDGDDQRTFWIVDAAGHRYGLIRLFDLEDAAAGDGYPLFDLRVSSKSRGRGVGEQAVRWLTRHLFESFPALHRIEGTTRADNAPMRRLFRKCGYVKEGHYRRAWHAMDGSLHDATHYAILREDWERGVVTPVPQDEDGAGRRSST